MNTRKSVDIAAIGWMVIICLIWAFQQIGLKYTASDAAPVLQMGLRSGIAALAVWLFIKAKGQSVRWLGRTAALGGLAGLLFGMEFFLVGAALHYTSTSHVVVFLYTAPIFAGIGLHFTLSSERLSVVQWVGVGFASFGIAFCFLSMDANQSDDIALSAALLGDLLALLGGITWATTTVLIRASPLANLPPTHILLYQLATAFVIITFSATVAGYGKITLSGILVANLAFQALIVSCLSFLMWFWLLSKYKASQLGVFSFMTPLFGVALGAALLREPLTVEFVIGTVTVFIGVCIVSAYPWFMRRNR